MSEVKVNKLSPRSGTTVTLGDSGDTITLPAGVTLANSGTFTNFTSTGIDDNATSTAITIDSSERVGIGETSMDGLLVIKGDSNSSSMPSIRLKDGADAREAFVTNQSGDLILATTNSSDDVIDSAIKIYTSQMIFTVDGSESMRIDSSGNVGIGTSSPGAELHIYRGDGEGDANLILETGTDSGSVEPGIYLKGYATNSEPSIYFGDRFSYPGKITYDNVDDHLHINTNGSERMRIDSSGNVGIGTTSPSTP